MSLAKQYWEQLYSNLVNASPVDTRNMVTHITLYGMVETDTTYELLISAPYKTNPKMKNRTTVNGYSDYASAVNNSGVHKGWIEEQMKLTENIINSYGRYLGEEN